MDKNPKKKRTSAPPQRRILRHAVVLSLALHAAALTASALWPREEVAAPPAPPPIKIRTVTLPPPPAPRPADAKTTAAPRAQATEIKAAPAARAKPDAAQPEMRMETATPELVAPRALSPMTASGPVPPPAAPAGPAANQATPLDAAKPLPRMPRPALEQARPGARLVATSASPPPGSVETVTPRSPAHSPFAAAVGTAASVYRKVALHPGAALAPAGPAPRGNTPAANPAALVLEGKILTAPSSPLQAIHVESEPSSLVETGSRAPAAAVETSTRPRAGADIAPLAIARVPAGFTGVDLGALREGYFSSVRSRVAGNRHYPVPARRRGHEGRPVVSFLLDKAGELRELSLLESSGHATLDRAALAAVEKAAPFPAIPEMLGERSMRFKLPVSFRLESP